jgi:hypothetical protein
VFDTVAAESQWLIKRDPQRLRAGLHARPWTFGFSDEANLDEGAMWPTSFALKELTAVEEKKIGPLVKKAVS